MNLVREGSGLEFDGVAEAGLYLGGPIGGTLSIGLSAMGRGYGFGIIPDQAVSFLRAGNATNETFSLADTRVLTLATAEAGLHATLRFGPLGSEDGMHMTLGFGGRMIWPQYYVNIAADPASQVTVSPSNTNVNVAMTGFRSEDFAYGIRRFVIGLGKKVLIANVVGRVADQAFDQAPGTLSAPVAWLGVVCYAFQIYFDFSGYSDMAIGLGRMFGFRFLENFRYPYISSSIQEFWRR